jgi:eukaryotic-like serine/threonine-protein kinase
MSPQGDRVAFMLDSGINDIWSLDLTRGVRTRLTFGPVANTYPVWSPDGKWIAYGSMRPGSRGIFRKLADGGGAEETLVSDQDATGLIPTDWSRDDKTLFYSTGLLTGSEIWALPLDGERTPHLVVARGNGGTLSPNGRWLAYTSIESGQVKVFVVPTAPAKASGRSPQWRAGAAVEQRWQRALLL